MSKKEGKNKTGGDPHAAAGGHGSVGGYDPHAAGGYPPSGAYPPPGGHGSPAPGGHGAPPQGGYGAYGAPPPGQGYGAPPPGQGYGAPPPGQGYGAPPPGQGYGAPPPAQHGYSAPPPSGYGAPGGYSAPGGYGGGFAPAPPLPPAGADTQLWGWFADVDKDRSGNISASELQAALINGDWTKFDLDTVKLLMTIFDTDRSGTITFNEFAGLWKYIKDWQNVFKHFDNDHSGSIDGRELANALEQFGYKLSSGVLQLVERKYVNEKASAPAAAGHGAAPGFPSHGAPAGFAPPGNGAGPTGITFDRFVRACVVIKQLTESFQKLDSDRDGWVQINYDQFMQTVLAAP